MYLSRFNYSVALNRSGIYKTSKKKDKLQFLEQTKYSQLRIF